MNKAEFMDKKTDYFSYARTFDGYKWYKPILVMIITGIFYMIFSGVIALVWSVTSIINGVDMRAMLDAFKSGYDGFNSYSFAGAFVSLGAVAVIIPALFVASNIVKDRPFSSYSSIMGGWRMKIFFRCFGISLVICAIPITIISFAEGQFMPARFTLAGFITCTILGPLQCLAEEYLFRGLIAQSIRSWIPSTALAIIITALIFMSQHPYNIWGKTEIFLTGTAMCIMTWIAGGIEASSAIHIVNNLTLFYLTGFGIGRISSGSDYKDVLETVLIDAVYIVILLIIKKKFHWFDEKKADPTP